MYCIYTHIDNNERCFYVGATKSPDTRPFDLDNRSEKWFNHYNSFGLKQVNREFYETKADAREAEEELTQLLIDSGEPLTNVFIGCKWDEETKQKLSSKRKQLQEHYNLDSPFNSHPRFKGLVYGVNSDDKVILFNGSADMNSRFNGYVAGNISKCLNGHKETCRGFTLRRITTLEELNSMNLSNFYDKESEKIYNQFTI